MVVNIIQELEAMGLSEYESKAYVALLGFDLPLTAYEVAKQSGIPTSKVYEVISRLQEREMILPAVEGGKKKYSARDPEECVDAYRQRVEQSLGALRSELKKLRRGRGESVIWNYRDYDGLLDKAERMILEARSTLLVSLWREEATLLENALAEAKARGLKLSVVHFGEGPALPGAFFPHPIEDTLFAEKGGRGLVVVADSREALVGTVVTPPRAEIEGAWSSNRGFVALAEDYVKHDVYIMKIVARFERELVARFGENYGLLRDVFSDKEVGK
jgi:HTH-type transcriptional regulator, sugar sensing transcriptional regulator